MMKIVQNQFLYTKHHGRTVYENYDFYIFTATNTQNTPIYRNGADILVIKQGQNHPPPPESGKN